MVLLPAGRPFMVLLPAGRPFIGSPLVHKTSAPAGGAFRVLLTSRLKFRCRLFHMVSLPAGGPFIFSPLAYKSTVPADGLFIFR